MTSQAFTRILVGVDDSPAAMAGARLAIRVAASSGGCIRFVNVLSDGELTQALTLMQHDGGLQERRSAAAEGLLRHVAGEADRAGVPADTVSLNGQPAAILLAQARDWAADLVVLGRADVRGPGHPFVGTVTRHVLEFSERPVLVVPRPL